MSGSRPASGPSRNEAAKFSSGASQATPAAAKTAEMLAYDLELILQEVFDLADQTAADDAETDRLVQLYVTASSLVRTLRLQAEAASGLESGGTLRDAAARHCWLRLRRHRPVGNKRRGDRYWWDGCARCGRTITVGVEDGGPR